MAEPELQVPSVAAASIAPPMAGAIKWGMAWHLANTAVTRGASLLAQIALGILLSKDDYGLFAIATSFALIAQALQDGGVRQFLIQRSKEFDRLSGPVFWMAGAINLGAGALLALAAALATPLYGTTKVTPLVLLIALSFPLGTPAMVFYARLYGDLRYRAAAGIQSTAAIIRFSLAVGLAWWGMGPMSLVIPVPVVAVVESVLGYLATRESPWRRPAEVARWNSLLRECRWVLLGTAASGLLNLGAYMIIGAMIPDKAVTGLYFFAYQLVAQVSIILAVNLHGVLFPALTRLVAEPARFCESVLRAVRMTMLVAAPASVGMSPLYRPTELLLWKGKWAAAEPAVHAIAAVYAVFIPIFVISAAQQAKGWFRAWGLMVTALAIGQVGASVLGAGLWPNPGGIAIVVAAHLCIASLVYVVWALRRLGGAWIDIARTLVPAWLIALVCGGATLSLRPWAPESPLAQLVLLGLEYSAMYVVLVRLLIPAHLAEVAAVLPARAARLLRFFLPRTA